MSGKPGKSGGARPGSGRPRKAYNCRCRVQFNLTPEAVEALQKAPIGKRSALVNQLIVTWNSQRETWKPVI